MNIWDHIALYNPRSRPLTQASIELGFRTERREAARPVLDDKEYIKPWKNRTLEDLKCLKLKKQLEAKIKQSEKTEKALHVPPFHTYES